MFCLHSVDDCASHLEQRMTKSRSLSKMSISSAGSSNYHLHREASYSLEDSEDDDESEMHVIYSPALHREHSPDEVPPQVNSKSHNKICGNYHLYHSSLFMQKTVHATNTFCFSLTLDYWAQQAYVSNRGSFEPFGAETDLTANWGISRTSKFEVNLHNLQVIILGL